ncbi:MAG: hypothetical protein [Olavius algarvensis Delta 4 endosymbiont]|nr:MAG: hypothetical protein [Olavius algarvensis Delta 4 endosymbiont]
MDLATREKKSIDSFFPEGTTLNEKRRIALLVLLSSVGIIFLIIFSIVAFFQGNPTLGSLDILTAFILTFNLIDARLRKRFQTNITVGTIFVSALFIYLYVSGGVGGTAFVWYFTYPLIACYLLGSRIGGLVSALMLIPVLTLLLIAPHNASLAQYSLSFVGRFMAAYVVTYSFAYFFERTRENNELEINEINQSLEKLVSIRTQELASTNEQLKKDILKREIAEKALKEKELKYRLITENATDIIWVLNLNTLKFEYVSPSIERIRGFTIDEAMEMSLEQQLSPESYQAVIGIIEEELLQDNEEGIDKNRSQIIELEQSLKNGGYIWMETIASFIRDPHDNPISIMGVTRDIEARKKAESAMRESEKRYRSVFEKSTDAIFIVDKKTGKYLDVNESGVQLTGRSRSELRQLTTQVVVPDGAFEHLNLIDESNVNLDFGKVTYQRPDGTQRIALLSSLPIDSENVMGIARDITDELGLAEQLRQTQKMEAIGTLAGGIAHDFNNILSAILGYSELVLTVLPSDSAIKNKIEAIYSAGERARDLVSQILTFSRKDEQTKLQVELRAIIKDALRILRPAIPTTIQIQTQLNAKGRISADPSRIHQVIMNLCTNASQAMLTTGGILNISLAEIKLEGDAATTAQIPDGNYVKLIISDTGAGIPPEHLERIFDPFFTTKEVGKGTGLGLSVVHGIIKRHKGSILVQSDVDKGTDFEVYLPLSREMHQNETPQIDLTSGGNERVLLVDDEPDILVIEEEMLKALGYTVTATNNPIDALAIFADQPERFDLVITDMTMPAMTGEELAIELDKILPDIPTIICTGYSELMSKEKAASLGVNAFLMKPISMVDFSNTIRSVLDKNLN